MNHKRHIFNLVLVCSLFFGTFANVQPVRAAAILTVTNKNDSGAGSLRQAIADASDGDTITFSVTGKITLTSGNLLINKSLNIVGPGSASLTIDGNNASSIFWLGNNITDVISISGMTMTHGYSNPENPCTAGAINNSASLILDDVIITNNDASDTGTMCGFPRGGGIYSSGSLTITNSTISNNKVFWDGGGINFYSTNGTLSLSNVVISGNQVTGSASGGGIYFDGGNAQATLDNVTISNNSAQFSGGGIHIFDGNNLDATISEISITNSVITNNDSGGNGGGILAGNFSTVILDNTVVDSNNSGGGGGIYALNATLVQVTGSKIDENTAPFGDGGGMGINNSPVVITDSTIMKNSSASGGGLNTYNAPSVQITRSSIIENTGSIGGGIWAGEGSAITLKNSTIAKNTATSNGISGGGGIYVSDNTSASTLNINNSTISINHSAGYVGGIQVRPAVLNDVNISNSIIADNTSGVTPASDDCEGTLDSQDYNLIENTTNCTISGTTIHNITSQDPGLNALADNGGPTQTPGLQYTSPAINAGNNATCEATDQRGVSRPIAGTCDIGSVEYTANPVVTTTSETGEGALPVVIEFSPASTTITFAPALSGQTILLTQRIDLSQDVTIDGTSLSSPVNISGGDTNQIFKVNNIVTAQIKNLNLTHGNSATNGGAIENAGELRINNAVFSNNFASGFGGAIYNTGRLNITGGSFSNNSVSDGVTDFTFTTPWNSGGAIADVNGVLISISGTTFSNNTSEELGAAISCENNNAISIDTSTFTSNVSSWEGGALYIYTGCSVTAERNLFNQNIGNNGGAIYNGNSLTAYNNTFTGNSANLGGGGVYNDGTTFISKNNTFSGNSASDGGGIFNNGTFQLYNTILANNTSTDCYKQSGTLSANVNNLIMVNGGNTNDCGIPMLTTDPNLGALGNNSGPTFTMSLMSGSPAIDAGDDGTCTSSDQRGRFRPQGIHCDLGAFEANAIATFKSVATQDGWILESGETTTKGGGTPNAGGSVFQVGDNAADRQYRAILSFNTASLSDNAVITKVTLKFKYAGVTGTLPFNTHGKLLADIRKGAFSNNGTLKIGDFQAAASKNGALSFTSTKVNNWYSKVFSAANLQYINKTGVTQFRLRFTKDDNDDMGADFLKIYSGNAGATNRPQLIVEYYVP